MQLSNLCCIAAFGFTTPKYVVCGRSTVITYGWFDFKPFRGSGSGESKAFQDEQWQIQQEILRERANKGITKDKLKQKYQKDTEKTATKQEDLKNLSVDRAKPLGK
jgi:hypothetical protein